MAPGSNDTSGAGPAAIAADLLWRDCGPILALRRKSLATLLGVAEALRRRQQQEEGVEEFLTLHGAAVQGEGLAELWTAPGAHAWSRRAYQLMRGSANRPSSEAPGLAAHLDAFKLFALGLAARRGADHWFARPFWTPLPVAIPGTPLLLRGAGKLALHGIAAGRLVVSRGGRVRRLPLQVETECAGLRLEHGPVASLEGAEILLAPEIFDLPGSDCGGARRAVPLDPAFQRRARPLVVQALALVRQFQPEVFAQMRLLMRAIALKPLRAGGFQGVSFSDFPGAFILSLSANPYRFAEGLVHEFHHNRLFTIESAMPLVEDDGPGAALHYSPFRPDPRPVRGLLHGCYVFAAVWAFWDAVRRAGDSDELLHAYAVDRLVRIALQLVIARRQLAAHGGLTAAGGAFVLSLGDRVEEIVTETDLLGRPGDLPAVFCDPEGGLRIERHRSTGRQLTLAHALHRQLEKFRAGASSAPIRA